MDDKNKKSRFLEEIFLLIDISMDITYKILFFIWINIKINFTGRELWCSSYTTTYTLSIIKQVELIGYKVFVAVAIDPEDNIFIVYVVFFTIFNNIHSFHKAQIGLLQVDEALITVSLE